MILVANVKTFDGSGHYIGRQMLGRKGSTLANPFKIGAFGDRSRVLQLYAQWFWDMVKTKDGTAWGELQDLRRQVECGQDITLLCWCAPLACHGDIIKEYLSAASRKGG